LCYNLKTKKKSYDSIYISGTVQRIKVDPGAVANGLTEAKAVEFEI
jgi:hypothetical protein